jgi:hypothetical protein
MPDRDLYGRMYVLRPPFAPTDMVTPPLVFIPVDNMPVQAEGSSCAGVAPPARLVACRS